MIVIWPYWKDKDIQSLHLSIDLAVRNLRFDKRLVVVGDDPQRDDVAHIPSPRYTVEQYRQQYGLKMRHLRCCDAVYKLLKVIDSPIVSDSFLRVYDDMFFLGPVDLDDLLIQRHLGPVEPSDAPQKGWQELRRKTFFRLKESGLPTYDFSTHGPVVFEKAKLQHTIEQFDLMRQPALVETIYQNQWLQPEAQLIKSSFFRFVSCSNDWDQARPPRVLCVQNNHIGKNLVKVKEFLTSQPV